jgi:metallo-beta-lactamase class B
MFRRGPIFRRTCFIVMGLMLVGPAHGGQPAPSSRAAWNVPQQPFRIYGNTHYVGVRGLSSILITSNEGHVLIDGDLPESPPMIVASIRALGFRIEDVKLIVNSHVHFDHAGGVAELQRLSGATVAASPSSARVMRQGGVGRDDPQYGVVEPIHPVAQVKTVADDETLRVGTIAVTAHFTPGHTPGGTSWTWTSCENARCFNMVYADSLTPVSADGFLFTHSREYPNALKDFEKSFATLTAVPCDILLTPHPEASDLWGRLDRRARGVAPEPFADPTACRRYVDTARENLRKRVASEAGRAGILIRR